MEEEIKVRFDESDKRFAMLEKRFDDLKWYFGGAAGLFTIAYTVLSLVLNANFNAEKEGLRDFKKELKADLGRIDLPPVLELHGVDGKSLNGQDVDCTVVDASVIDKDTNTKRDVRWLRISHRLKNTGDSSTGPMFVKLYTNDPFRFDTVSSDEPKYRYEAFIMASQLTPPEIPGKFSNQWWHEFSLADQTPIKSGRYPALLRVYYGKGRVAEANISIVVQ